MGVRLPSKSAEAQSRPFAPRKRMFLKRPETSIRNPKSAFFLQIGKPVHILKYYNFDVEIFMFLKILVYL